jgi:hypothetical protein
MNVAQNMIDERPMDITWAVHVEVIVWRLDDHDMRESPMKTQ